MDHHEAAAADIAGARIGHGHRKANRDRGIDRIAATLEHIRADMRRDLLLRHHHAVLGDNRVRRIGIADRRRAVANILCARRHAECRRDASATTRVTSGLRLFAMNQIIKIPPRLKPIRDQAETRVRRNTYAIRTPMLQAKRHFVTRQDILSMAITLTEARSVDLQRNYPPRAAVISWIFFDWAAQPYFTLITTFVFAPYFATHVAADPASGQSLWGFATAAAGLVIALMSPVLGAIADASGRRKPWIAAFGALLVIGSGLMWFGKPGDPSVIPPLLLAYGIATIGVEFATVFNNAMMPTLVPPDKIGRLSGTGWATGYIGGILSLILVLGFLAASPETGRTLVRIYAAVRPRSRHPSGRSHHRSVDRHLVHHLRAADVFADAGLSRQARVARCAARGHDGPAADLARIAAAEIDRGVSARQHDLHRRPGFAVRVRRHLRRRDVRLEHDRDRHLRHYPRDRRHVGRMARRQARRCVRTEARDRRQHAGAAAGDHSPSCWSTRTACCSSR